MKKYFKLILVLTLLLATGCSSRNQDKETSKKDSQKKEEIVEKVEDKKETEQQPIVSKDEETKKDTNDSSTKVDKPTNKQPENNSPVPPKQDVPKKDDNEMITVSISIECKTILNNMDKIKPGYENFIPKSGYVLEKQTFKVEKETTVLELLQKACKENGKTLKESGGYVREIDYIPHHILNVAYDGMSGWMFGINGKYVNGSSNVVDLKDGDSVKWMYTCENGKDLSWS